MDRGEGVQEIMNLLVVVGGSTATADEKCDPRQYLQLKN